MNESGRLMFEWNSLMMIDMLVEIDIKYVMHKKSDKVIDIIFAASKH
jgi:hypothetical protein